jgi:hypothetical protein
VIEWVPRARFEVVKEAVPFEIVTGPPIWVEPSRKTSVPVKVPAPGETAVDVAVNVTGDSIVPGFDDVTSVVEVLAMLTICVTAEELVELLVVAFPA